MIKGKRPGTLNISYDSIMTIITMSQEGYSNSEISDKIGFSKFTVWKYRKKFLGK